MVHALRPLFAALVLFAATADVLSQVRIEPGYLGLMLDDRELAVGGVPVMRVHPRTPAEVAGFQVGDLVVSCNGSRVLSVSDFGRAIYQVGIGEQAVIQVQRGGQLFELTATLSSGPNRPLENFRPPVAPEISTDRLRDGRPMLGLVVGTIQTRSFGDYGALRQWGVVVEDIVPNSPAEKYRVPRGAVLTSINGLAIRSPDDVFAIMEQIDIDRPVELSYVLGGSAYRQQIPLAVMADGGDVETRPTTPYGVAKPLEEGMVIEPPYDPAPPVTGVGDDGLPELPPPDPIPPTDVRLPTSADASPDDVKAMRSELEELRRRAAAIQTELDAIRREASPK